MGVLLEVFIYIATAFVAVAGLIGFTLVSGSNVSEGTFCPSKIDDSIKQLSGISPSLKGLFTRGHKSQTNGDRIGETLEMRIGGRSEDDIDVRKLPESEKRTFAKKLAELTDLSISEIRRDCIILSGPTTSYYTNDYGTEEEIKSAAKDNREIGNELLKIQNKFEANKDQIVALIEELSLACKKPQKPAIASKTLVPEAVNSPSPNIGTGEQAQVDFATHRER